jgi:hypothetical protein
MDKLLTQEKKEFIIKHANKFDQNLKKNIVKTILMSDEITEDILYENSAYRETFIDLDLIPLNILDFIFNMVYSASVTELKLINI